jgi:hypothetical protein
MFTPNLITEFKERQDWEEDNSIIEIIDDFLVIEEILYTLYSDPIKAKVMMEDHINRCWQEHKSLMEQEL